jgi:hypothetical protein
VLLVGALVRGEARVAADAQDRSVDPRLGADVGRRERPKLLAEGNANAFAGASSADS